MVWQKVDSLETLKSLGKFREVIQMIQNDRPEDSIPKKSWDLLYNYVKTYQAEIQTSPKEEILPPLGSIASIEDLKELGTFIEVKKQLALYIGDDVKTIRGWQKLYDSLKKKELIGLNKPILPKNPTIGSYYSNYFKDEVSELIYYLLELDGEARMKKLGINKRYYSDKTLANAWKNKVMKRIHPDETKHGKAEEAAKELNKLYRSMIEFAK